MTVYIEDAILSTVLVDFSILFLTQYSLKQKFNFFKAFCSSVFACLFNLLINNFQFNNILLFILKICCGLIICTFMVKNFSFKNLILFFLVFTSFTFLLGGFSFALLFMFFGKIESVLAMPSFLTAILHVLLAIYIFFLTKVIKTFYKKQLFEKYIYKLKIIKDCKSFIFKGYMDSGNFLVEEKTKLPVIILNSKSFFKLFKNINMLDVLSLKLDKKINGEYIKCSSVNGEDTIFVFKTDEVFIQENNSFKKIKTYLGYSFKLTYKSENFDVLLNPLCIEN